MDIRILTRRYRREQKLTLEAFGERLAEGLTGYSFTRQAIHNWETGSSKPDKYFLVLVAMRYGDWRRAWALGCLAVLQPELFAPIEKTEPQPNGK